MNQPNADRGSIQSMKREGTFRLNVSFSYSEIAESASKSWETSQVWTEVGIIPPVSYCVVVELLHRLLIGEEGVVVMLARSLVSKSCDNDLFLVIDNVKLRLAAQEFGIHVGGRTDETIAREVADAIINEYVAAHQHPGIPE